MYMYILYAYKVSQVKYFCGSLALYLLLRQSVKKSTDYLANTSREIDRLPGQSVNHQGNLLRNLLRDCPENL